MAANKTAVECPALPAGSIDITALDKALAAGKSGEEAIAEAMKNNPVPDEVKPKASAEPAQKTAAPVAAPETSKE